MKEQRLSRSIRYDIDTQYTVVYPVKASQIKG